MAAFSPTHRPSASSTICRAATRVIFAVHLWNPTGEEPETIWQILNRTKDIQYSSRIANHILRQRETHKLRHVITQLLEYVPEEEKSDPLYQELAGYHCETRMHVVRLLAPRLDNESHTKDIDFSPAGIRRRWEAGYSRHHACAERAALDRRVGAARWRRLARTMPRPELAVEQPTAEEVRSGRPAAGACGRVAERSRKRGTLRARKALGERGLTCYGRSYPSTASAERSTTVLSPDSRPMGVLRIIGTAPPSICTIDAAKSRISLISLSRTKGRLGRICLCMLAFGSTGKLAACRRRPVNDPADQKKPDATKPVDMKPSASPTP